MVIEWVFKSYRVGTQVIELVIQTRQVKKKKKSKKFLLVKN